MTEKPKMQTAEELFEILMKNVSADDKAEVTRAYEYARAAHKGQFRKSGEEYITHPLHVAIILSEIGLDRTSMVAALLHDCVEDTDVTSEEVEAKFGSDVVRLVDGVTKLGKIVYDSKEEAQMEDLRRMFIAMAKDIRVIIIKLCDRLHNMRTSMFWSERKQVEKQIDAGTYHLDCLVKIEALPNAVNFIDCGKGRLRHEKEGFYLTFYDYRKEEETTMFFSSKSLFSIHTEYDYRSKKGQCVTLSTREDTYFIYPLVEGFNATKIQFATEYLHKFVPKKRKPISYREEEIPDCGCIYG